MISALYFSPLFLKELDGRFALHHAAAERRAAGDDLAHLASMAGKSSGVKGWLRAKS